MPEPRDLSPEELLALYPSTHAERDSSQPGTTDAGAGQPAAEPPTVVAVGTPAGDVAAVQPAPASEPAVLPAAVVVAAAIPVEAPAPLPPPGPSVTVETPPAEYAPATVTPAAQPQPGVRVTGRASQAGGPGSL